MERNECKEPMIPMEIQNYPYQVVGVDLFDCRGKIYLMAVDHLSKWPVIKELVHTTSNFAIETFKAVFAEYGIPEVLISDNGPQFSSREFKLFGSRYGFKRRTSFPIHTQGN